MSLFFNSNKINGIPHLPAASKPGGVAGGLLYSNKSDECAFQGQSHPIHSAGAPPLFAGRYGLYRGEIAAMKQGLRGWPGMPGVVGPDYFPAPGVEAALLATLGKPTESLSQDVLQKLAAAKARVANNYALILNLPLSTAQALLPETKTFAQQLKDQIADCDRVFITQFGFSPTEVDLFHRFVAKTAPILFNMGFPDAIPHAAQVSRLAVIKAYEELTASGNGKPNQSVDTATLLQTAMVGWLHDPKFPGHLSADNLGSHPLVASAIAEMVFHTPDVEAPLKNYLSQHNTLSFRQFTHGAMEAVSINNDSRFVMQYVILPRVVEQVEANFGKQTAERFESLARDRMDASSQGRKPKAFPEEILAALQGVTLKTGITGINKTAWENTCQKSGETDSPEALLEKILTGDTETEAILPRLSGLLRAESHPLVECTVDGQSLFSHHEEVVPSGRTASLALINADPLMLSPHKIIAVESEKKSLVDSLSAFMASFQSNIDDLPLRSQEKARQWQRAVYISIIRAAEKLSGRELLGPENDSPHFKTSGDDLKDQVNFLSLAILMNETWGDYGALTKANPDFETALSTVEAEYLRMTKEFRSAAFEEEGLAKK